jgi:sporulation protein YlmC with PRC-barrel domain
MIEQAMRPSLRSARGVSAVAAVAAALALTGPAWAADLRVAQATATPAAPAPTPETKPAESLGTPAIVIDGKAAESLLGKKVQSAKGEDLGRIVDVIVDKAGQIRAAVVDFGGFLGVGSRKIAVDWHLVHMSQDGKLDYLIVDMPPDQLRSAPAYKEGEPVVVLGPAADQAKAPPPAAQTPAAPAAPPAAAPAPAAPAPAAPN